MKKKDRYSLEKIRKEISFYDYFFEVDNFHKEYYPASFFIKSCGELENKKKNGDWLYFNRSGILSKIVKYQKDEIISEDRVDYEIKKKYLIISLANIIGGLYELPIKNLYYDSKIKDYTQKDYDKFYYYLEINLRIIIKRRYHIYFQELIDDIAWLLNGGRVKEYIKNEIIFADYFENYLEEKVSGKLNFIKRYYNKTHFINHFIMKKEGKRHGSWLYFDSDGFLEKESIYENGKLKNSIEVDINSKMNRYYILFSLGNIISGIYKNSIEDLCFDSKIKHYISRYNNIDVFYKYLENKLNIKFDHYEHELFEELIDEIKNKL